MARAMEEEEERGEPLPPIWDDAIGEGGKGRRHARDFNPEATALRKLILTVWKTFVFFCIRYRYLMKISIRYRTWFENF